MGAWGHNPLQNDAAADWLGEIGDLCSEKVAAMLGQERMEAEWEEVRAACWLLERLGETYVWPPNTLTVQIKQGIDWLIWLRDESEWHQDWKEPDDLQASLSEQIASLTQKLTLVEPIAKSLE